MEFEPHNLNTFIRLRKKEKHNAQLSGIHAISTTAFITIKLFMYQIFRALAYIHFKGICHLDIKPSNLLYNPDTGVLKICVPLEGLFGLFILIYLNYFPNICSAYFLNTGERNVSYICARYYSAHEMLLGATDYTNKIGTSLLFIVYNLILTCFFCRHLDSRVVLS